MIKLKCFSEQGVDKVRSAIDAHTDGSKKGSHGAPISLDDLNEIIGMASDDSLLEKTNLSIQLDETKKFKSSYELGEYVFSLLKDNNPEEIDSGVWTWLAIVYISQLLRYRKKDDKYLLGSSYRYVFDKNVRLRYYRHLVYMPWYLYQFLDTDSYIFLYSPPFESGEFLAQAQKDEVVSNRELIAMCAKYYFDSDKNKFASGFFGTNKEDVRTLRWLVQVIVPQLSVNFDIRHCNKDALFDLLPDSFKNNAFPIAKLK